jgi:hypothetical protein
MVCKTPSPNKKSKMGWRFDSGSTSV